MHSLIELKIINAVLDGLKLIVYLNDGRIIIYPMAGMDWITDAPEEVRSTFTVDEWEIYWEAIDDGLTLEHILSPKPRVDFTVEPAPNWHNFQVVIDRMNENEVGLEERVQRGSKTKFLAAMANVADVEPPDIRDRVPTPFGSFYIMKIKPDL